MFTPVEARSPVVEAIAKFERTLIGERAAEGRAVARARGVRFGRPAALTAAQVRRAQAERAADKPVVAIALDLDVSPPVIYRALRDEAIEQALA